MNCLIENDYISVFFILVLLNELPRNKKHKWIFSIIYTYIYVYYINQDLNASHRSGFHTRGDSLAERSYEVGVVVTFKGESGPGSQLGSQLIGGKHPWIFVGLKNHP
jgi:hypothetical protein